MSGAETILPRPSTAFLWRLASQAVQLVVQLGVTVVLARILTPLEFGLASLAVLVGGFFVVLADACVIPALVQREQLTEADLRVGVGLSVVVGLLVSAVVFVGAPTFADLFDAEDATPLIRLIAGGIAVRSAAGVADAISQRKLAYRRLFYLESAAYVGYGLIAILLASADAGELALIGAFVAHWCLRSLGLTLSFRHSWRMSFAGVDTWRYVRFGFGSSIGQVFNYAALSGDNAVVAGTLGERSLGVYGRSYQLMLLPTVQWTNAMNAVLFPTLSRLQGDRKRVRHLYLQSVELSGIVVTPLLIGLVLCADTIVLGLYGEQWVEAVPVTRILAIGGLFRTFYNLGDTLDRSMGAVKRLALRQATFACMVILAAAVGRRWQLIGVAAGVTLAIALMAALTWRFVVAPLGIRASALARAVAPGASLAVLVGSVWTAINLGTTAAGAGEVHRLLALALSYPLIFGWWLKRDRHAGAEYIRAALRDAWEATRSARRDGTPC